MYCCSAGIWIGKRAEGDKGSAPNARAQRCNKSECSFHVNLGVVHSKILLRQVITVIFLVPRLLCLKCTH